MAMVGLQKPSISQRPMTFWTSFESKNWSAYFLLSEFIKTSFLQCFLLSFSVIWWTTPTYLIPPPASICQINLYLLDLFDAIHTKKPACYTHIACHFSSKLKMTSKHEKMLICFWFDRFLINAFVLPHASLDENIAGFGILYELLPPSLWFNLIMPSLNSLKK